MIGNERNKISVCNSHAGRLLTGLGQLGAGSGQNFFVSHFPYFIHSKKKNNTVNPQTFIAPRRLKPIQAFLKRIKSGRNKIGKHSEKYLKTRQLTVGSLLVKWQSFMSVFSSNKWNSHRFQRSENRPHGNISPVYLRTSRKRFPSCYSL